MILIKVIKDISRHTIYLFFCVSILCGKPVKGQYVDFSDSKIYTIGAEVLLQNVAEVLKNICLEQGDLDLSIAPGISNEIFTNASVLLLSENESNKLPENIRSDIEKLPDIGPDGYKIIVYKESRNVVIVGHDARGVLFGIGYLGRKSKFRPKNWLIPEDLKISSTPVYPVRGHQLGYRPKTNAYDAWTVEQFDTYIRDLALFGNNSIEIMPPRTDDDWTSPVMKLTAAEMMVKQSAICEKYGLDVWMWYPNMGKDYISPEAIERELEERDSVFGALSKLDAVFIPGADPGDLEPDVLFDWMARVAEVLEKHHPAAKIWVSPQSMRPDEKWYKTFYEEVNKEHSWLGGVVYGPWVKESIQEVRKSVNENIPIRRYPDITHNFSCQYPVPYMDLAFAMTLGRESYNPRPAVQKHIHNILAEYAIGSISYSEGINDDVNKFIWSDQNWDPEIPVIETLRDYARYFIHPDYAEEIAQGLLSLEENVQGPLLTNENVEVTLQQWQNLEKQVPSEVRNNYRFQMGLLLAYYEAYIQSRLIYESGLEIKAKDILLRAEKSGSLKVIEEALSVFDRAQKEPVRQDLKNRCLELGDLLFDNIGYQLLMEKHFAQDGRGNFLDYIDIPLNDSEWYRFRMEKIEKMPDESDRLAAIDDLLNRTDPGPGGFYDNFGSVGSYKRVISPFTWMEDPGSISSPVIDFGLKLNGVDRTKTPLAWRNQITTHYTTPLVVRYENLDPEAQYTIRITYSGRFGARMKLTANDILVHDFIRTGNDQAIYEFSVPREATQSGEVLFSWMGEEAGRGTQVAEIWMIRNPD